MTILVIDARSREQHCFVASATKHPNHSAALVLRKAGGIIGTVEKLHGQIVEHPILVVGSYQAQSSAGYTAQLHGGSAFREVTWVGGAGFGFSSYDEDTGEEIRRGYGLRPFGYPLSGTLIPPGARVERVETHENSNHATAKAAYDGLSLMVELNQRLFILEEGQSDYTSATSFEVPKDAEQPEFLDEHRADDIFSAESMLESGLRRMLDRSESREGGTALRYAHLNAVIAAGESLREAGLILPEIFCDLLGTEVIEAIVQKRYAELIQAGWQFDSRTAVSPTGEETSSSKQLVHNPVVEEEFSHLMYGGAKAWDEERKGVYNHEISHVLTQHFWYQWVTKDRLGDHDFLVEAYFDDENAPMRLWFSECERPGPMGEPLVGHNRFLCAWDRVAEQAHLHPNLINLHRMVITAYTADTVVAGSREWIATESDSPYVKRALKK